MNRKGFTLVELLATIIILAIVMSFGAFAITHLINASKEENYNYLINNIKDGAETYYQECKFSNNSGITCSDDGVISLGDLVKYGYLKGNAKADDKSFTINNPKDQQPINTCNIKVSFADGKIVIEDMTKGGSCPTQEDYNK